MVPFICDYRKCTCTVFSLIFFFNYKFMTVLIHLNFPIHFSIGSAQTIRHKLFLWYSMALKYFFLWVSIRHWWITESNVYCLCHNEFFANLIVFCEFKDFSEENHSMSWMLLNAGYTSFGGVNLYVEHCSKLRKT